MRILLILLPLTFLLSINGLFAQEDTVYYSDVYNFTEYVGSNELYSITKLGPTSFAIAYVEGGVYDGKVKLGEVTDEGEIIWGSEKVFYGSFMQRLEITTLSENSFLVTFKINPFILMTKGTINNGVISFSPYYVFNGSPDYVTLGLNESKFIIAYVDPEVTSDKGKCAIMEIIDNQFNVLSESVFNSESIYDEDIAIDTLSSSRIAITHGNNGGSVVIGNMSNDIVSFGSVYEYRSKWTEEAFHPKIVSLSENRFAIGFIDEYGVRNSTLLLGNVVNNNEITFIDEVVCNNSSTNNIELIALQEDKLILGYQLYGADESSFIYGANINNNTIELNEEFSNDIYTGNIKMAAIDETMFLCIYSDTESFEGKLKVGSTIPFGMSSGCLFEGITFNTQEQIDNFQTDYPGCTEIEGDVWVEGDSITNLNGLSVLTSIGGYLYIAYNHELNSLSGLDNVTSIGGYLRIEYNGALTSLTGMDNIEAATIAGLSIQGNNSLSTCEVESVCNYLSAPNDTIAIHNNATGCSNREEIELACEMTDINADLTVQNETIIDDQADCFNATITITVAGSGTTVDIQSGGEATFIAGETIYLKPGFHSHSGSTTHAYITTTGDYCGSQQSMVASVESVVDELMTNPKIYILDEPSVNIYPNPTTGHFTIDFSGKKTTADIMLVNFQGKQMITQQCKDQLKMDIDIGNLPSGMYILLIKTENELITKKIIKNY